MRQELIIRRGYEEDCEELYNMVYELWEYERISMTKDINVQAGFMLYFFTYSIEVGKSMYLREFFIREHYRGHGVGSQLFQVLAKEAYNNKCKEVVWQVLKWIPARKFYEKYKAENMTESKGWQLYVKPIKKNEK
ncbi:thialysine N-epsilon-acetyltransferase isoform X2 [Daktulosphaira vitifoliae]|uniref:thialysine N-epsilon-acetyltransferase isoform X2 n=1 Tax=Daktulosphaira vitifoliae TaxID=58002 RepID=UPI0021AABFD9|nr:thialysine N-epsilon-acetyltransferase isoform X2 [Daktulosphaira vitifoliae]